MTEQEQKIIEDVARAIDLLKKAIIEAFERVREWLFKTAAIVRDWFWRWMATNAPNRRVAHLAKYGKTARVRKKNRKRIMRDFWRSI